MTAPTASPTPVAQPASAKQTQFVRSLMASKAVPPPLFNQVQGFLDRGLTHTECTDIIPKLLDCPKVESYEDWTSPEGYDDSPDMGVHRYDGGGAW